MDHPFLDFSDESILTNWCIVVIGEEHRREITFRSDSHPLLNNWIRITFLNSRLDEHAVSLRTSSRQRVPSRRYDNDYTQVGMNHRRIN